MKIHKFTSRLTLFLGAITLATSAFADADPPATSPWSIEFSGTARHFKKPVNTDHTWNEKNWGIGIQYKQPESVRPGVACTLQAL